MACSKYQGKNQCGFHSAHYVLTDQHVQEYCSTDRFQSCSEIENFAQSPQDTESEFRSQLDRDALAKLGQPMHNLAI